MTSDAVSSWTKIKKSGRRLSPEQVAAAAMVAQAREQGLALTGPGGLLKLFTKSVLETALTEEMTEHLGYEKHDAGPDPGVGEYPQWFPAENSDLGRSGRGGDRCPAGSGGHI